MGKFFSWLILFLPNDAAHKQRNTLSASGAICLLCLHRGQRNTTAKIAPVCQLRLYSTEKLM